jgi:hypothetical protein
MRQASRPDPEQVMQPVVAALDYLSRARQFRRSAVTMPDMENGQPFWPKHSLIMHSIELAIKAYLAIHNGQGNVSNHDLTGLYEKAVQLGLRRNPNIVTADLEYLSELHSEHYARYPNEAAKPIAMISYFDDLADQLIADVQEAIQGRRNRD